MSASSRDEKEKLLVKGLGDSIGLIVAGLDTCFEGRDSVVNNEQSGPLYYIRFNGKDAMEASGRARKLLSTTDNGLAKAYIKSSYEEITSNPEIIKFDFKKLLKLEEKDYDKAMSDITLAKASLRFDKDNGVGIGRA